MAYTCFEVETADKVAHIRLSRSDALNSMVPAFWTELPRIVTELSDSGTVRAVVISSTGKHFSSGMDLSVFTGPALRRDGEPGRAGATLGLLVQQLQATFTALETARMPVLVAVQGGCIGGAVDLVSAADLRYATADAFFQVAETNIGMTADVGTLQRLPKIVPDGIAREMVFTGMRLPAQRAKEVGLVNEVYPDQASMLDAVLGIAGEIASKSPLAVWGAKEALAYARDHSVAEGLRQIALWQTGALHSADIVESLTATKDRRPPAYADLPPVPGPLG